MNRKIVTLLIVLIAAVSIASVCAVELTKENDFDGLFKMKVAEGDNFTNISDPNSNQAYGIAQSNMAYRNNNSTIYVFVYGNSGIKDAITVMSDGEIDFQYKKGLDLVKSEGDVSAFDANATLLDEPSEGSSVTLTTFAGVDDGGNLAVLVGGNDADLVKEYAKTIKFD